MNLRGAVSAAALLAITATVAGCGTQQDDKTDGGATPKQVKMDEKQATERAEKIIHEAVDSMSPKPTLKAVGGSPIGPCVARDDHGPDDRVQLSLTYQLTGVPGTDAKKLVRQARDSWVKLGYKFQSSDADGDWSDPFPSVDMRTEPDDFWIDAVTGVVDRKKGEGLAAITVTSPCFTSGESASAHASPAALHPSQTDEDAEKRVLGHSSRIYDALHASHGPAQEGEGLRTVQDAEGASLLHTWSTVPLTEDEAARVMGRAQAYFERTGWSVRALGTGEGSDASAVVALHGQDGSIAQVAQSSTRKIQVAVSTPADAVLRDTEV
ncbi:hypothetical protein AB0I49_12755 [Streptomyces sp. NPDC050617]|uniref:hypothetical protein n=1 Tax=Streptomyces sp. NPDC050617 TaxID=3154628 RepID=UPI00342065BB